MLRRQTSTPLYQAIDPKRCEGKAIGSDAGADCHRGFDRHPGERHVLKSKRLPDQHAPVIRGIGWTSEAALMIALRNSNRNYPPSALMRQIWTTPTQP